MKTFDSRHYQLQGYLKEGVQGVPGWLFQRKATQVSEQYFVSEAKYVENGIVFYLKQDGRIENSLRQEVELANHV